MLNQAPIFINGFQRGGTNILMNLIMSHPEVHCLDGETHELFYGKYHAPLLEKLVSNALYVPIVIGTRQHTFGYKLLEERNPLPRPLRKYLDFLLHRNRVLEPMAPEQNGNGHSAQQGNGRLLCKNVNGIVMLTPTFAAMYPDATFFALVRHGLAVCEGFVRRGADAADVGRLYRTICQKMIADAEQRENYHLIRFEEIIADPVTAVREIYSLAGLPLTEANRFRLQAKPSMSKNGERAYMFGGSEDREIQWFSIEELPTCFRKNVNDNQIARLSAADKKAFMQQAADVMDYFGYTE